MSRRALSAASFGFYGSQPIIDSGFRVTVSAWQSAVVFRDGELLNILGPGRHRRPSRSEWHLIDLREQLITTASQEMLTSDGIQVRFTLNISYKISDPSAWILRSSTPLESLYSFFQILLRDRVSAIEFAALSESRSDLLDGAVEAANSALSELGLTIVSAVVKDFTLPAEIRQVLAETTLAKQRGLAALEEARSQVASLRALANAAKLVKENPEILQLREVEALSHGGQLIVKRNSRTQNSE